MIFYFTIFFPSPFQIITQLEAVDAGVKEINKWLDEGDALLASFSLHGTSENIQGQLDRHKVYILFSIHSFRLFFEFLKCYLRLFKCIFMCIFGPMFYFPFDLLLRKKKAWIPCTHAFRSHDL